MMAVLDVIMENVPELMALDLSDSNLSALDSLIVLAVKVPNLSILHTGRNQVSYCI
jgi:Leucine-rich repeat (LRR) protein